MAERPDNPNADAPLEEPPDEQVVHHVSQRKKRKKGVGGEEIELNLTSMIDVIFQLLIYFVITANFQIDEGTILATLPGNAAENREQQNIEPPVVIELTSGDDGITSRLIVDGRELREGVAQLRGYFEGQIGSGEMAKDDIVQIKPQGVVRWQHVVNVFNACVAAELEQVGFAPS